MCIPLQIVFLLLCPGNLLIRFIEVKKFRYSDAMSFTDFGFRKSSLTKDQGRLRDFNVKSDQFALQLIKQNKQNFEKINWRKDAVNMLLVILLELYIIVNWSQPKLSLPI